MRKIGCAFSVTFVMAVLLTLPCHLKAGGLRTGLGEAVIENLQIGQTYNLKDLANLRLSVTNTGSYPVDLQIDVILPNSSELRHGAVPIPDTSWVKLSQNVFKVGSQQEALSDISISIPDEDRFLGKKFQVMIWSHTVGEGSMYLAVGLKSRIVFTTATVKASKSEIVKFSNVSVDFSLKPEEIHLDNIELDKTYDVEEETGLVLTITNPNQREQTFKLRSRAVENSAATLTKECYDTPDASYLKFSETEFVLPPEGTKTVKMYLDFPANKEYSGKKYMFIIHAYAADDRVTTGVYSRLYALTK